jgi:CubicO group peptidase (beta-lactamase class C family)
MNLFKNSVLIVILLIAGALNAQTSQQKIDELLTTYTNLYQFNGTAWVESKGAVLLNKGYGYSNVADKVMNTEQTIFQIGSVTKQFTAMVILKLVEKKKLSLTDKLSKFYPTFPKGDSITIAHLLSHTSGIFNYTNDGKFMNSEAVKPADEAKMLALFKDKPLDFSPGTKWSYSNSGYMLLGYIIQKVSGKTYEQNVRKYIFKPLKMTHSGFDFVGLKDKNKATGYFSINEKGAMVSTLVDSTVSYSAGAMYTTTEDLHKWHVGILNNKIIKRAMLEKAFTPVLNKYGFGWSIDSIDGKRITVHSGGIFGFNANYLRIEADNVSIALLNNVGNPKLSEITNKIMAVLYNKPYELPQAKVTIALSEDALKPFVGKYELSPQFHIAIMLEDGHLVAQATNQPKFELFAQKANYFFLKAVEAEIQFDRNDKGEVTNLLLYQGGRKTIGKKIE